MKYNYYDIKNAYEKIGMSKGMTVLIKTDLRFLGPYESNSQNDLLAAHFNVLVDLVDLSVGTIVVSTASFSLCNTDNVFDILNTPSEMGSLTEYVRTRPGSVRSFHPFASYAAIGKNANYICENTGRINTGPNSPQARLLELDAQYLCVGVSPSRSSSVIHHIEQLMGVPYRYTKEFIHPVLRNGAIVYEPFYLFLKYFECNVVIDLDNKVYPYFYSEGFKTKEENLGRGKVYSCSMNDFYLSSVKLLTKDIYACLEGEPIIRPYRT
jgi:aminoglycoside 3-N-acetyltransferase